jgi:hypothetical protein
MQLRSGRHYQNLAKERPLTPTSLYQWRECTRCPRCYLSPKSAVCECRCSRTWLQLQRNRCQCFGNTQRNYRYALRCDACGSHLSGGSSTPREQPQSCVCGGNHTASYRGSVKWKEAKATHAKQAPEVVRPSAATSRSTAPKAQRAGPSAEQIDMGEGWNHVVRGGVLSTPTPLYQIINHLLNR